MSDLAPFLRHLPDCSAWAPVSVALASTATEARPCTCGLRSVLASIGARQEWHPAVEGRPEPHELWKQADGDRDRYLDLMREHGHIVPGKRPPGEDVFGHSQRDDPCTISGLHTHTFNGSHARSPLDLIETAAEACAGELAEARHQLAALRRPEIFDVIQAARWVVSAGEEDEGGEWDLSHEELTKAVRALDALDAHSESDE